MILRLSNRARARFGAACIVSVLAGSCAEPEPGPGVANNVPPQMPAGAPPVGMAGMPPTMTMTMPVLPGAAGMPGAGVPTAGMPLAGAPQVVGVPQAGAAPVGGGPAATGGAGAPVDVPRCKYKRKNAKNLTPEERAAFAAAVVKLKQMPSPYDPKYNYYDQFVYWHIALQYCDPNSKAPMMLGHGAPMFLPWHREHLLLFDKALDEVSEAPIAIPYWDWTDRDTSYIFKDDFMGGNGDRAQNRALMTGPFKRDAFVVKIFPPGLMGGASTFVQRSLGIPEMLPTKAQVDAALEIPNYDSAPWNLMSDPRQSFRTRLEGNAGGGAIFGGAGNECPSSGVMALPIGGMTLHNAVHVWVNGSLLTSASPNDPVFFLHHANTDRIWWEWQKKHGIDSYVPKNELPKNSNNDEMFPFNDNGIHATPAMVADSEKLGVCYE